MNIYEFHKYNSYENIYVLAGNIMKANGGNTVEIYIGDLNDYTSLGVHPSIGEARGQFQLNHPSVGFTIWDVTFKHGHEPAPENRIDFI